MTINPVGSVGYSDIPTVETERLRLRANRLDDLEPLSQIWATPEVTRFIGGKTRSPSDVWQQIQRSIGCWALLGYGYWVIEEKSTNTCIGEIGFMEGLRQIEPSFSGTPEAGWVIAKTHWRQGYATEALGEALGWRDGSVPSNRTVCIIEPEHAVSIRIAKAHGFQKLADTHIAGDPICVFERNI